MYAGGKGRERFRGRWKLSVDIPTVAEGNLKSVNETQFTGGVRPGFCYSESSQRTNWFSHCHIGTAPPLEFHD